MASIKEVIDTSNAITITLTGLAAASGTSRESTAVDNSTNLYLDAMVGYRISVTTGTAGLDRAIYIYAWGSEDGTTYTDNVTGADAAITMTNPNNFQLLKVVVAQTGGTGVQGIAGSVASCFGGNMPRKWGVVVRNECGLQLGGTWCAGAGGTGTLGSAVWYSGIFASAT